MSDAPGRHALPIFDPRLLVRCGGSIRCSDSAPEIKRGIESLIWVHGRIIDVRRLCR